MHLQWKFWDDKWQFAEREDKKQVHLHVARGGFNDVGGLVEMVWAYVQQRQKVHS